MHGAASRPTLGLQIVTLNATTSNEIDAAFAGFARDRPDALFVAPDVFFNSRRDQFSDLAARDRIPAIYDTAGLSPQAG